MQKAELITALHVNEKQLKISYYYKPPKKMAVTNMLDSLVSDFQTPILKPELKPQLV